ncbi:MAG: hypothetical protein Q7S57_03655 [bacterium]|nr:hypothetical protein [bacterium]
MTTKSEFSVLGLAHKFFTAAEERGFNKAKINALAENPTMLQNCYDLFIGQARIVYIVDLDAYPFMPDGWELLEHHKGGQFEFEPAKIALFLSEDQKGDRQIRGYDLGNELRVHAGFNANLLDFLIAHPLLIPKDWNGKTVFFWGTHYRNADGVCVRYLDWGGESWIWNYYYLADDLTCEEPAAVPAQP